MGMDPISLTLMAAATVMSAGGSIYSGVQQKKQADANAELARRDGRQEEDAAIAQAEKIRRAGKSAVSRANAAMAASGVSIGEGTPLLINEQIYRDSESDAYSTLLTGARRKQSAYDQAGMMEAEGKAARTAGYINATSTLLSSGSKAAGWKKGG